MKCPVCNGTSFAEWGNTGVYSIVRCKECGLGITSPFPSPETSQEINREIYQVEQRIQIYLSRKHYFEERYAGYVANIKKFKRGGTLLDVGCNIGLFLTVAREKGFDVVGIELNRECAEYGKVHFNLEIYSDYLEKSAFAAGSFDVVTLFDVLEHVPDIHGFISEIKRILKAEGILVIQSPNIQSLMAKLTGVQWSWLTPPDHLYHFTPGALLKLLKSHDFKPLRLKTWEPAKDFCDNLLLVHNGKNIVYKTLSKVRRFSSIVTFLILVLQKLWWRKQMGGLIELYAVKCGKTADKEERD